MLYSRKPYCQNCQNRGSADGTHDYHLYPCSCAEEIAKEHPDKIYWDEKDKMGYVTEKQRCPDKRFFKPIYTIEQLKEHNNHK